MEAVPPLPLEDVVVPPLPLEEVLVPAPAPDEPPEVAAPEPPEPVGTGLASPPPQATRSKAGINREMGFSIAARRWLWALAATAAPSVKWASRPTEQLSFRSSEPAAVAAESQ